MRVLQADISLRVAELLKNLVNAHRDYLPINRELKKISGIVDFFTDRADYIDLKNDIKNFALTVSDHNRIEYGDFQTPPDLSDNVCRYLAKKKIKPELVIEPTCGKGNFIISSLKHLKSVTAVYAVEIYKPYVWESKFNIINYYLQNPDEKKVSIHLFHENIFDFDFIGLRRQLEKKEFLIVGNPPWVTNSTLSGLNSQNLPVKVNIKNHNGLDAITGKGNFDISEYISLKMLEHFSDKNGVMAFLIKNSVIRNIIRDLNRNKFKIGSLEKLNIDAKKEFNAFVDAALFYCRFNKEDAYAYRCKEKDFYKSSSKTRIFGWVDDKFVSDIERYAANKSYDRISPLVWRSGHKHDCSRVMELKKSNGKYTNKLRETIELEEDLVFEFLKSSDLKRRIITNSQKFTIVTQRKIGQSTGYIKDNYPLTYKYLSAKEKFFLERKSSIYRNKPAFSIFGIGDYTFKKFKVAISGLYKDSMFSLIVPDNEKPILLDDTCYFLGFDSLSDAIYTFLLLNHHTTQDFLKSLVFLDDKRAYTKELLMRIDLVKIAENVSFDEIEKAADSSVPIYRDEVTEKTWERYIKMLTAEQAENAPVQRSLF